MLMNKQGTRKITRLQSLTGVSLVLASYGLWYEGKDLDPGPATFQAK